MQIITDRRALHRIPELDRDLPKTLEYVTAALQGLGCYVSTPTAGSICAWFDFGAASGIAFRADLDALPITECTGAAYASTHPGKMHACGHDGHTAILLELARRLSKKKGLRHNILLIFQPAEETTGGARAICESGILQEHRVEAVFGLHIWPGLEKGAIFCRENEVMSHACEVDVQFYGRSAHVAKAHEGIDTMAAAAEFLRQAAQAEEAYPDHIHRLLKFGHMESGTVRNAVAAHSRLEGCLRAFQDEVFDGLKQSLFDIATRVEQQFGCRVEIGLNDGYPAVMNPPELVRAVSALVPLAHPGDPSMTAEDFAWYQRCVPGLFFWLGAGDVSPLHSNDFDFDESILTRGADFFETLAETF